MNKQEQVPEFGSAVEFLRYVRDTIKKCCGECECVVREVLGDGEFYVKFDVKDWMLGDEDTWVNVSNKELNISVGEDRHVRIPLDSFRNVGVRLTHWRCDMSVDVRGGSFEIDVGGWRKLSIALHATGTDSLEIHVEVEDVSPLVCYRNP